MNPKEIDELEKVIKYIDARAEKLAWDTRKEFLKAWLDGQDTERFFYKEPPEKGILGVNGPVTHH